MLDGTALVGVLGALAGAAASTVTTWLTHRSQARREAVQRSYAERTRWTDEKRALFRDIQSATLDWMRLLRQVASDLSDDVEPAVSDDQLLAMERKFHLLGFETDLLADSGVYRTVDELEDGLRVLTRRLGRPTEFRWPQPYEIASPAAAREAAADVLGNDFREVDEIRIRLMKAMRQELRDY